jgi:hypothetical protein
MTTEAAPQRYGYSAQGLPAILVTNGEHTGGTTIRNSSQALQSEARAKPEAAARVLRRLGLAIKTSALYPASYPGKAETIDALLRDLRAYTDAYGPFSLHVGRQTLSVDGVSIDGHSNLADLLYRRKVSQVTILPTAAESQIGTFVYIAGMERSQLEAAGGLEHLLQKAGVWDIQVTELILRVKEDADILDLGAFYSLLGRGRLSPDERDRVIDILRSGSDQVAALLKNVYALAGEVRDEIGDEDQGQQVYQTIRSLDRIILDEPADRQEPLYEHLAGATLLLDEPMDRQVVPALLSGAGDDTGVQIVLHHLSAEQLAQLVLKALAPEATPDRLTAMLCGLPLERGKAQGVLSMLDARLPQQERQRSLTDAILPQLRLVSEGPEAAPSPAAFDESSILISAEELAGYRKEAQSIDEAGARREALRTLLDLLRTEGEQKALLDVADALAGYLRGLIERGDYELLRESLEALTAGASAAPAPRIEVIDGLLDGVANGLFLDRVLGVMSEGRNNLAAQTIRACLEILGKRVIGPLLRMLGAEQRVERYELIADLLAGLGRQHVDVLGTFLTEGGSPLVRHVADVFGRMRSPEAVPYLARLVRHVDLRVRMATLAALANIGTDAAQAHLCTFLSDPEPMMQLRALSSLDAQGIRRVVPLLIDAVDAPDLLNRRFTFRRAAINALARTRVRDALPSLKRLAGALFVLGRCRGELRRLARLAVASIETPPVPATSGADGAR